jgi:hypothetical protein
MKKIVAVIGFCLSAIIVVHAQQKDPALVNLKEVQKLQLRKSAFVPARVESGSLFHISKAVQLLNIPATRVRPEVQMTGTPSSVISKGVARMQYERRFKKINYRQD